MQFHKVQKGVLLEVKSKERKSHFQISEPHSELVSQEFGRSSSSRKKGKRGDESFCFLTVKSTA